jgi:hypothetical protein
MIIAPLLKRNNLRTSHVLTDGTCADCLRKNHVHGDGINTEHAIASSQALKRVKASTHQQLPLEISHAGIDNDFINEETLRGRKQGNDGGGVREEMPIGAVIPNAFQDDDTTDKHRKHGDAIDFGVQSQRFENLSGLKGKVYVLLAGNHVMPFISHSSNRRKSWLNHGIARGVVDFPQHAKLAQVVDGIEYVHFVKQEHDVRSFKGRFTHCPMRSKSPDRLKEPKSSIYWTEPGYFS